jgi:hypothetical protein
MVLSTLPRLAEVVASLKPRIDFPQTTSLCLEHVSVKGKMAYPSGLIGGVSRER